MAEVLRNGKEAPLSFSASLLLGPPPWAHCSVKAGIFSSSTSMGFGSLPNK